MKPWMLAIPILLVALGCKTTKTESYGPVQLADGTDNSVLDVRLRQLEGLAKEYPKKSEYPYQMAGVYYQKEDYKETAKDGHSGPISYAWVTNHFKNNSVDCAGYDPFNWFGTCSDQCPVAYSIGSSGADAQWRLLNERYNLTFSDPTSINYYWILYYEGCNPVGETTFNP